MTFLIATARYLVRCRMFFPIFSERMHLFFTRPSVRYLRASVDQSINSLGGIAKRRE